MIHIGIMSTKRVWFLYFSFTIFFPFPLRSLVLLDANFVSFCFLGYSRIDDDH